MIQTVHFVFVEGNLLKMNHLWVLGLESTLNCLKFANYHLFSRYKLDRLI